MSRNSVLEEFNVNRLAELQDRTPRQAQSAIQFWLDRECYK